MLSSCRDWRWHIAQLLDGRNPVAMPVGLLLLTSAAIAYVVIAYEGPRVAELQTELQRLRTDTAPARVKSTRPVEPSPSVSVTPAVASNLIARAGDLAKAAGLGSVTLSNETAEKSADVERVSLKARGTYAQSKAFLASLLNDSKVVVTTLEIRASEPGQVEVRVYIAATALKVE